MLRFGTDAFRVVYDMEIRLDFSEKRQRFALASPVTKQRQCFTDDIPSDIKTGACRNGICREILGLFVVDVLLVEAGVEERCVTEQAGWKRHCQFHVRTHVNENSERARETATAAVTRYDAISRIARKSSMIETDNYDWDGMLATGRNLYGNPEQCIEIVHNATRHYYFDTLTTTFNFGGIPHEEIKKSMRLFAKEIMPAFR